jgi:sigma-B regulation protein RsbU (phosphoserine phosphatase)
MNKKPVILCVDDEKIVLNSLKAELKGHFSDKYMIETAESGDDALEVFSELSVDGYEIILVISDYIMPKMKGDDFLIALHQTAPHIVKILLTGQANLEGITNAVNHANLYRYLTKPWEKNDFLLTVEEAIKSYYKEKALEEKTVELLNMNLMLEKKVEERTKALEIQTQNIQSSINYAKRIQQALLPTKEQITEIFPENFVFYQPKDIVSGDFYWVYAVNQYKVVAVIDCTGHGVPGAFMTLITHAILSNIIVEKEIISPDKVLQVLHKEIVKVLKQDVNSHIRDGLDIALCVVNADKKVMEYAGAKNEVIFFQNNLQHTLEADRFSIGGEIEKERTFTKHTVQLSSPTMCYLFTDGYKDQFGGEKKERFKTKRLKELLQTIYVREMEDQYSQLVITITEWMNTHKQIDDMLVMGILLA